MVVIVSLSLSLISSGLKPLKDRNEMVDKKTKILKSVVDVSEEEEKNIFTAEFVLGEYEKKITEVTIDYKGNITEGEEAFDLEIRKEMKKPEDERTYPVFIYQEGSEKYYIIPLTGLGLWDELSGYLALGGDFNTIKGVAYDHRGETPGLGARITEYWFRKQFAGKKLYEANEYAFDVLKGENHKDLKEFEVDGLSGATLTTDGLDEMLRKCVNEFEPYFNKIKS